MLSGTNSTCQTGAEWHAQEHPDWALSVISNVYIHLTTTSEPTICILTVRKGADEVAYGVFDWHNAHLHYMETRPDHRRSGLAAGIWQEIQRCLGKQPITTCPDTESGRAWAVAQGFKDNGSGMWTWTPEKEQGGH